MRVTPDGTATSGRHIHCSHVDTDPFRSVPERAEAAMATQQQQSGGGRTSIADLDAITAAIQLYIDDVAQR
jgi:hypothetical protein